MFTPPATASAETGLCASCAPPPPTPSWHGRVARSGSIVSCRLALPVSTVVPSSATASSVASYWPGGSTPPPSRCPSHRQRSRGFLLPASRVRTTAPLAWSAIARVTVSGSVARAGSPGGPSTVPSSVSVCPPCGNRSGVVAARCTCSPVAVPGSSSPAVSVIGPVPAVVLETVSVYGSVAVTGLGAAQTLKLVSA